MKRIFMFGCGVLMACTMGFSQYYNNNAGRNVMMVPATDASTGEVKKDEAGQIVYEKAEADHYGNAQGSQYDLAVDGAFEGQTIAVLHLYTGEGFDFSLPKEALKQKGFGVYRWLNYPPSVEEFKAKLDSACQLWIISDSYVKLSAEHVAVIKEFFDSGKGVYIWGDNDPYYADANLVSEALIGTGMFGNLMGDNVVTLDSKGTNIGLMPNHLITTGLENVYEGITIATLDSNVTLTPLIYGSAGNLVCGAYEEDGKRLILDGGFTRLYYKWDTAGTDRYVKNAAAWLVNIERFAEETGMLEEK